MKILITGNRGFVGTQTQKIFTKNSIETIGYDIMDGFDIRDRQQLELVINENKPDRILHLAAIARFADADNNPMLAHQTNVIGTKNVADVAIKHHIPLVYSSTGSVYMPIQNEPPITENFPAIGNSVYGVTKNLGELFVKNATPHIILRYAHLYGKGKKRHGLIGGILSRIERGLEPELYGGKQSNDFCYIKDIAEANFLAITSDWDCWNQVYNIGTGEELTAQAATEIICKAADYAGKINIKKPREADALRFVYDISKARTWLGYKPKYSFKQGLKDMFK